MSDERIPSEKRVNNYIGYSEIAFRFMSRYYQKDVVRMIGARWPEALKYVNGTKILCNALVEVSDATKVRMLEMPRLQLRRIGVELKK